VRRWSLYTAVFLLAAALPGGNSKAAAPGAEPPSSDPVPGSLRVIASSQPPAPPPAPVMPVPNDGLQLQPAPIRLPAVTPGVQAVGAIAPAGSEAGVVQPAAAPEKAAPLPMPADTGHATEPPPAAAGRTASVYVEKSGPADHVLGKPLAYEILVRNPGTATAAQVRVEDDLPAGVRCLRTEPPAEVRGQQLVWQLGGLDAGAERRLRVEVDPASEGDYEGSVTASCSTAAAPMRTHVTRPRLTLTMTGPAKADVGDAVPFQLVVGNTGSGPANHVVLHDRLPAGLQHTQGNDIEADLGTLAAGGTKTVSLAATAVKGGRQVNEATVSGDNGLQAAARAEVQISEGALLVRKTGPQQTVLHREVDYRLEVVNPGQAPAANVMLADNLPAGLEFLSAGDGGAYTAATRSVQWSLGALAPGASRAVTLRLLARTPGDWVNQAIAHADHGLEAKATAAVHVEGIPALMLEAVDLDDPIEVGAETSYEIRVVNQGTGACHNVQIQATVPDGMTALDAQGPAPHRIQGQQVTFDPVPKLAARADIRFRIRVRAVQRGDWRFKVNLTCAELQRPVYKEESTCVYDGNVDNRPVK
jgi:uncharacterized repeat protein (TIGR01451 family)